MKEHLGLWVASTAVILVIIALIGARIKHHPFGILIDSRNRMSLSRFQLTLWTVLITATFFTLAIKVRSMNIYISPEIWALLGISVGSGAGSVIVNSSKVAQEPDPAKIDLQRFTKDTNRKRSGVLAVMEKARFSDMFLGEEITDFNYVDIGKVQMFFFSIAAVAGYAAALWAAPDLTAAKPPGVDEEHAAYFPVLSTAIVTLLGISHAGYLTVKAAPTTPTAS